MKKTKEEIDTFFGIELNFVDSQIKMLEHAINNGCWIGYSENLEVRKSKLKKIKKERDRIYSDYKKALEGIFDPIEYIFDSDYRSDVFNLFDEDECRVFYSFKTPEEVDYYLRTKSDEL